MATYTKAQMIVKRAEMHYTEARKELRQKLEWMVRDFAKVQKTLDKPWDEEPDHLIQECYAASFVTGSSSMEDVSRLKGRVEVLKQHLDEVKAIVEDWDEDVKQAASKK